MKIIDAFTFNNELDLLEIRLHELNNVVDHFVLSESTVTHANKPKPLYFSLNRERFRPFLHKIDLVIFDDVKNPSSWGIENDHRRSLSEKIPVNLQDEDIILISDVDEIPRKEAISKLKNLQEKDFPLTLCYNMYSGSFYNKVIEPANHLQNDSTVALKFGQYKQKPDPQFYRDERSVKYPRIHDAGWHFTSMGGPRSVRKKVYSFAHDEYRNSDLDFSESALAERIKNGQDLFYRPGYRIEKVKINDTFPRYLSANKIGQNLGEVFRGNLESGSKNSLLESLILAQNERWRRG